MGHDPARAAEEEAWGEYALGTPASSDASFCSSPDDDKAAADTSVDNLRTRYASEFHRWWDYKRAKFRAATGNPLAEPFTGLPLPFQHPRWSQDTPGGPQASTAGNGPTTSPGPDIGSEEPNPLINDPSRAPQDNPEDWTPFLDGQALRTAGGEEPDDPADRFLADMHGNPRYADFLGDDYATGRTEVVMAIHFADDVALAVRQRRIATPMRHA